jgi:hypothetical protein
MRTICLLSNRRHVGRKRPRPVYCNEIADPGVAFAQPPRQRHRSCARKDVTDSPPCENASRDSAPLKSHGLDHEVIGAGVALQPIAW